MSLETLQILTYSVCTSVLQQVYYKPSVQKMFCFSSRLQIHALGDYMKSSDAKPAKSISDEFIYLYNFYKPYYYQSKYIWVVLILLTFA